MAERISFVAALPPPPDTQRVIMLGDSTVIQAAGGRALPEQLHEELLRLRPQAVEVQHLADFGISAFEYYAFAEKLTRTHPGVVVLAFNPRAFFDGWRSQWSRKEAYGWIEATRLPEVISKPLHWFGMTLDQLLFYKLAVATGCNRLWRMMRAEQVRTGDGLERFRKWAQTQAPQWLGGRGTALPIPAAGFTDNTNTRLNKEALTERYIDPLRHISADHPVFELFGSFLRILRADGIPVVAYIVPVDVEHMRRMGVEDLHLLERAGSLACTIVRDHGSACLDLHDALPDAAFSDAFGHYHAGPDMNGIGLIARRLAPEVSRALDQRVEALAGHP